MGYVSIAACALIAVYAVYHFQVRSATKKVKENTVLREHDQSQGKSVAGRPDKLDHVPPELQNGATVSPSFSVSPPQVDITIPEEELSTEQSQPISVTKDKTMPPPPPPPSIKTTRSSSPPRLKPPTFGNMPAPPRPANGFVRPPPSAAASLRVPQTKILSNTSMAPSGLGVPKKQSSRQVQLKPGHSPMDWAALTKNPNSRLRGKDAPENLIKISPSQLKQQNGRKGRDAWTTYQGKVYNISAYLPFHPGGEGELLRGAGKDSLKLFMEVHPWVNWDGMLAECVVGILVSEEEMERNQNEATNLDEMD